MRQPPTPLLLLLPVLRLLVRLHQLKARSVENGILILVVACSEELGYPCRGGGGSHVSALLVVRKGRKLEDGGTFTGAAGDEFRGIRTHGIG